MVFFGEEVGKYMWIVYTIGIVIVLLIGLMLVGVDIQGMLGLRKSASSPPSEITFWKNYDPLVPLRISATEIGQRIQFDTYSLIADMVWLNTRVADESDVYRHILHRGSGEGADFLQMTSPDIRQASSDAKTGPSREVVLRRMPQGLPIRMNPGIMADPVTNDMILFFDTEKDNESYRESVRIPDIPMDQPFRLGIVVMYTMVEVYINCQLEVTKLLEGRPLSMETSWYGLIGPSPLNAIVQNLRLFAGAMGPAQMRTYCNTLPVFSDTLSLCDKRQIQAQAASAIQSA